jgi:hypothetical protein
MAVTAQVSRQEAIEAEITHLGLLVIGLTTDVADLAGEVRRLREKQEGSARGL